MLLALTLLATLATASPAPTSTSPAPTSTPITVYPPIPCGWIIDRIKLDYGGKIPEMATVEFIGRVYGKALQMRGFDPQKGKPPVQLTRQMLAQAAVDIMGCFGP